MRRRHRVAGRHAPETLQRKVDIKMYYYKRSHLSSNVEEAVCGFRYVRLDEETCGRSATSSS